MSTEVSVVCDTCSRLIATETTRADARETARQVGAVRVGRPPRDVCSECQRADA